uniref:Uncharacterized protein n=1 Tax=Haptolina ericina TaxID=156174 RepID=A0A7S3BZN6_9EUKA
MRQPAGGAKGNSSSQLSAEQLQAANDPVKEPLYLVGMDAHSALDPIIIVLHREAEQSQDSDSWRQKHLETNVEPNQLPCAEHGANGEARKQQLETGRRRVGDG